MKTEKSILLAFFLNLAFALLELVGGMLSGSIAIASDAVHDLGDAMSIGLSGLLERRSKRAPDEAYTYGYSRYSVLGSAITTLLLLLGSFAVIGGAIWRLFTPREIHYDGMILLAAVGVLVNLLATLLLRGGGSLNERAVGLHMLEDVLGWAVVLVGAVVMRFTGLSVIDPLMSLGVSLFILVGAVGNLRETLSVFLEKTPRGVDVGELREQLCRLDGVSGVHHIHIWSIDGQQHCATMHVVTADDPYKVKERLREELSAHGIGHVTLELEREGEECREGHCHHDPSPTPGHHHHRHHRHRHE